VKKKFFILFGVLTLILSACGDEEVTKDDGPDAEGTKQEEVQKKKEDKEPKEKDDSDDKKEEKKPTETKGSKIEKVVKGVVDSDLNRTTINELTINEDASVDEERYIVLVNLKWDVKNTANMTKDMLDMYSDHLAAKLADDKNVHELVIFWEVPYHKEGDTILKKAYQNENDGMYLSDENKDISIFE